MNTEYQNSLSYKSRELANSANVFRALACRPQLGDLSDTAQINAYGTCSLWVHVYNREDLEKAMALGVPGTMWTKKNCVDCLSYSQMLEDEVEMRIYVHDGALPPTCKVITEVVNHPAREAYTETIEKIVCDV